MQSKTKIRKRSVTSLNPALADSDRLSGLPDEILCHILSFLPTKNSVKTSILSRRWRFLWAYVPNLFFGCREHHDIIYRVMLLHKAESINTLCITGWNDCSDLQMDTWITFAIMRNVQKLDLWVDHYGVFSRCLFTCKTLVHLRLDNSGFIPKAGAVCLPRLKKLHLTNVGYEDDESLPHLLSGCPVLEDLVLTVNKRLISCYKVTSPTIERLTVHFRCRRSKSYDCRLVINTPSLGYLRISDCFGGFVNFNSLIEADIYLHKDNKKQQYDFLCSQSVLKFIDWLRLLKAKILRLDLSSYRSKIVSLKFFAGTTSFPTLTKLELVADCCLVTKFLENADNLETLIFSEKSEEEKIWMEPRLVPKCLLSHLKVVKIVIMVDKRKMFEMVKYLLRYAGVLEKMEITYPGSLDSEEKINMFKEISMFQRASKVCEVAFVEVV